MTVPGGTRPPSDESGSQAQAGPPAPPVTVALSLRPSRSPSTAPAPPASSRRRRCPHPTRARWVGRIWSGRRRRTCSELATPGCQPAGGPSESERLRHAERRRDGHLARPTATPPSTPARAARPGHLSPPAVAETAATASAPRGPAGRPGPSGPSGRRPDRLPQRYGSGRRGAVTPRSDPPISPRTLIRSEPRLSRERGSASAGVCVCAGGD